MDEQKQSELIIGVGARVVAGLAGLALGTLAVHWAKSMFARSCSWIAGEVTFVMVGQLACLCAWAVLFRRASFHR